MVSVDLASIAGALARATWSRLDQKEKAIQISLNGLYFYAATTYAPAVVWGGRPRPPRLYFQSHYRSL